MSPFKFHPIDTAPKDGMPILVRCPTGYTCEAWWNAQAEYPEDERSVYAPNWYDGHGFLSGVTEWMPIPDDAACASYAALKAALEKLITVSVDWHSDADRKQALDQAREALALAGSK